MNTSKDGIMKVLHVGNLASVGYYLVRGLRRIGVDAELFDWRNTNIIAREEVDWIHGPTGKLTDKYALKSLKIGDYDIIHLHYLHSDYNVVQSLKHISRAGNPVKFVHSHDSINDGTRNFLPMLKSAVVRFGARAVFFSTPNILDNISHFPQKKIFLPNPVDTRLFSPTDSNVIMDRMLCWVKLDPMKGYEIVADAMKLAPDIGFDVPEVGELVPIFKGHLPRNMRFIKPVAHFDAPKLLAQYPVVLEQFIVGAFGMSGLEAMACAKPVISYWKEGNDSFYPEPCPVVSARTPEEIVAAISETLPEFRKIGQASREWVQKYHSAENVAKRLLVEYETALD
ncbi:MAG: glycosyltransferase family 4 protein [Thermoplasmata archaeon]|nr:glycosyltransferase family 4 protein [Thermoplasmata archaeon]